jgi:proline dehydrogenase
MNLIHKAALGLMPAVPRSLVRKLAGRYIAGETLDDLIRVASGLHAKGFLTTVDVLGENSTSEEAAKAAKDEYLRAVNGLSDAGLASQVSVKLTLLGLRLREELARDLLGMIVVHAGARGISVCIDMEDSSTTDAILRIYRDTLEAHPGVSVAIQAYLKRSLSDVESLLPLKPSIRICKGIYTEPPAIAYQDRGSICRSFLSIVKVLVEGGGFPAIATHDPLLVDRSLQVLREAGIGPGGHEFQMLLGVGERLRPRILARGSRLRLYCPYGPDWYAYSLRRLKENPRMIGYAMKGLLSGR